MTLYLAADGGASVSAGPANAAAALNDTASSMPSGVDGGIATGPLLAIIAAVAGTAGDLAVINVVAAQQVMYATSTAGETDAEVLASFGELGSVLR